MSRDNTVSDEISRILAAANSGETHEKTASQAPVVQHGDMRLSEWGLKLAAELRGADTVTVGDIDALLLKESGYGTNLISEGLGKARKLWRSAKGAPKKFKAQVGAGMDAVDPEGAKAVAKVAPTPKAAPTPKRPSYTRQGVASGHTLRKAPRLSKDKVPLTTAARDKVDESFKAVAKAKAKAKPAAAASEGLTGTQMAGIGAMGAGAAGTGAMAGSLYERNKPWYDKI